jgi:hypothetical protein
MRRGCRFGAMDNRHEPCAPAAPRRDRRRPAPDPGMKKAALRAARGAAAGGYFGALAADAAAAGAFGSSSLPPDLLAM